MFKFIRTKKQDPRLVERMLIHYSQPKGFVGRSICYAVIYNNVYYGHIVWGTATRFLPGRHEYLNTTEKDLNNIVNNLFFNVSPVEKKYPIYNFTTKIVALSMKQISEDWYSKYIDRVIGFETLVEKPRTGELYKRCGFEVVGETVGFTCKRVATKIMHDSWGGTRVWNHSRNQLRPKLVLCCKQQNA